MSNAAGGSGGNSVVGIITQVANELGIPPALALAIAQQESGLDPHAVGDNGSSFGLFQLHQGGELGNHDSAWAFDPTNNARTALSVVASVYKQHPDWSWGQIAAAAQRPADQQGYAQSVNSIVQSGQYGNAPSASAYTYNQSAGTPSASGAGQGLPKYDAQGVAHTVQAEYGFAAAFINSQPELKKIFDQATSGGWDQYRLEGAIKSSGWYQTHSQTQRAFDSLAKEDPAEYHSQINHTASHITDLAHQIGASLTTGPKGQLLQITELALRNGLSDDEISKLLAQHIQFTRGQDLAGQAGNLENELRQYAADMGVPLSEDAVAHYAKYSLIGQYSPDTVKGLIKDQALTLFPSLTKQLNSGLTVKDIAQPYIQQYANTLEVNPSGIDLTDPLIKKALQQQDPKTGQFAMQPLWQFDQTLKSDPRWQHTTNGVNDAYSLLNQIGQDWGFTK